MSKIHSIPAPSERELSTSSTPSPSASSQPSKKAKVPDTAHEAGSPDLINNLNADPLNAETQQVIQSIMVTLNE